MKTLYTLFACTVVLFSLYFPSNAIELESFTAKDGFQTAYNYASGSLGLNDPELLAVSTAKAEIEVLGTTFQVGMSIENGQSEGWSYAFISRQSGHVVMVGVGKFLGSYQAQDVTGQIPDFPIDTNSSKLNENWINSDDFVASVKSNSNYQSFISSNPNATPNVVMLTNNYTVPTLMQDYPYWVINFDADSNFVCFTDALTGETVCETLTSVKPIQQVSNSIAPNPASNYIRLELTDFPISISIIDNIGNKVFQSNNRQLHNINLTNLSSGVYTLIYEYQNSLETEKLIINK